MNPAETFLAAVFFATVITVIVNVIISVYKDANEGEE